MDQRCRLCLNIYSVDLLSQFNSSLSDSSSVYEFYKILTSVDLEIQEDRDRSWICQKCLTKLSLFYDFRCLLIDNNKTFIKCGFDDPISTECSDIKDEYSDSNSPAPYEESCLAFDELELCDKIKAEPIEISVVQIAPDKTDESNRKWTRKTSPDDVDWEPRSQRVLRPKPVEAIKTKPLKSKNLKPKDSLISKYLAKYGKLLDEEDNLPLTKRQVKCLVPGCGKQILYIRLRAHVLRRHSKLNPVFSCDYCEETFPKKTYLKKHLILESRKVDPADRKSPKSHQFPKRNSKPERVICSTCGKSFSTVHVLNKHVKRIHLNRKDFTCDMCGKRFFNKSPLNVHFLRHLGTKNYRCNHCTSAFSSCDALKTHVKNYHSGVMPLLPCSFPECNSKFKLQVSLDGHIKFKHLRLRPFVCHCGKDFYSKYLLKNHAAEHLEIKNFPCTAEGCNKSFKGVWRLKQHVSGAHERKYKCGLCDKTFIGPGDKKRHENLHNNVREFKCTHCEKAYVNPVHLKNHIRDTHFKSKISCELCRVKLARAENYTMHVKKVHKDIGEEKMNDLLCRIKRIKPDFDKMEYVFV